MSDSSLCVMELQAADEIRSVAGTSLTLDLDKHGNVTLLVPVTPTRVQHDLAECIRRVVRTR